MIEQVIEIIETDDGKFERTTYYEVLENGEKVIRGQATVAINDTPTPDPEVPETNDVSWDAMAKAIMEGVNEV